jgi:F0F1-type ATP synthase membrane subunit b/b'
MAAAQRRMDEEAAVVKADIGRAREGLLAAARREADAVQRKALEAIEQAKLQALAEVRRRAVDLAIAAAERIIARRLDAEDERRFAQEAIDALRPPEAR